MTAEGGKRRELRRRNSRLRLLYPHLVVMEGGAAERRDGFGTGEHIDAAATDMGLVGVYGFGDQHATPHAVEMPRGQAGLAAHIAERNRIAVGNPERRRVVG